MSKELRNKGLKRMREKFQLILVFVNDLGTYRKVGTPKFLWKTDLEVYEGCWVFMTVASLSSQ